MINIGLIDVDLLDGGTRHPNLAQMKMAGFCIKHKDEYNIHDVHLIFKENELDSLTNFNILLVSKVFNFTKMPEQLNDLIKKSGCTLNELNSSVLNILENSKKISFDRTKVLIGGTGFFEDGGNNLDDIIEHTMPYYDLYNEYIEYKVKQGRNKSYYFDYLNSSIGFTTRGCFRKCSFCVNKKYNCCKLHSPVSEFLDKSRDIIYLWDDNFFALGRGWEKILDDLNATGKKFQFRQGLDIRLMKEGHAKKLANSNYYGDFIFAFDHIQDKELIIRKLAIWRKYCSKETKLYVLCAYDSRSCDPVYGIKGNLSLESKDLVDIENTFERIIILMKFGCLPYIMRYQYYLDSPYKGIYTQLARWCNQPAIFKKMSFREFCERNQVYMKTNELCAPMRALKLLEHDAPQIYEKYVNVKYMDKKDTWQSEYTQPLKDDIDIISVTYNNK